MKRRNFFKNLGIGIGALVVAPKVLAEVVKEEPKNVFDVEAIKEQQEYIKNNKWYEDGRWHIFKNMKLSEDYNHIHFFDISTTYRRLPRTGDSIIVKDMKTGKEEQAWVKDSYNGNIEIRFFIDDYHNTLSPSSNDLVFALFGYS